eukprot:CAMPEP_0194526886 /NCGR_PEP_ID=MMETSP0253-20130528/62807_1 /TAXON_ID=2966 /ORGANISM="Noctiluca scintillans" /LENGTH=52 /DNA_ID=CAMNT_0039371747 /DNA_START=124 /DNA_END=279 /DNA_ORIENTATION=-
MHNVVQGNAEKTCPPSLVAEEVVRSELLQKSDLLCTECERPKSGNSDQQVHV